MRFINYRLSRVATNLLAMLIAGCVIFSGCSQSSTTVNSDRVNSNSTNMEESSSDSSENISETITEKVTEQVTEEPTTPPLNYEELIDFDAKHPYMIKINRAKNFTTIYGIDKDGRYSVPYKVFICSTGREVDFTPLGTFELGQKYDWRLMVDYTYAQYAIRISGPIMLHSVPYYTKNKNDLEIEEYAKLGSPASLGCIRYTVADIKWIYDNCPDGTKVLIYDSTIEEPLLEIPTIILPKSKGKKAGWDPTDPDKKNPWNKNKKKNINSTRNNNSNSNNNKNNDNDTDSTNATNTNIDSESTTSGQ